MSEANKVMSNAKTDALFNAAREALPQEARKADLWAEVRRTQY